MMLMLTSSEKISHFTKKLYVLFLVLIMKKFRLINSGKYLYPNGKHCLKNSVIQALKRNESKAFGYICFLVGHQQIFSKIFHYTYKSSFKSRFLYLVFSHEIVF